MSRLPSVTVSTTAPRFDWPSRHEVDTTRSPVHPGEPRRTVVVDRPSQRREAGPREARTGRERAR